MLKGNVLEYVFAFFRKCSKVKVEVDRNRNSKVQIYKNMIT